MRLLFYFLLALHLLRSSHALLIHQKQHHYRLPLSQRSQQKCAKGALKFGICGSCLGLVHEVVGTPPSKECCTLIEGLADVEAAMCLCTAIKDNVLGVIKVKIPIALTLLINACGKKVPEYVHKISLSP
ncbi:hypothetical protein REPUB_Repub12eG0197500 [Reevesia pubescens]